MWGWKQEEGDGTDRSSHERLSWGGMTEEMVGSGEEMGESGEEEKLPRSLLGRSWGVVGRLCNIGRVV